MPGHDIIVIGGSAGAVDALREIAGGLPRDLPAAVLVVVHIAPSARSLLPDILSHRGPLPAAHAVDGEPVEPGRIYVAPPDYHLLVEDSRLRLGHGPRENRVRPAVDPLFRTAARSYGSRVVGVVLTGSLDDGTVGLGAVKRLGGIGVVQDPADALYPGMPQSAAQRVEVDYCVPLDQMAPLLGRLAREPAPKRRPAVAAQMEYESRFAVMDPAAYGPGQRPGKPTPFRCPECGGVLWELNGGQPTHFRCTVGHSYSNETLISAQGEMLEGALWSAMSALEERAMLQRRMAESARGRGSELTARRMEEVAEDAERQTQLLRATLGSPSLFLPASEMEDEEPGQGALAKVPGPSA